MIIGIIGESCTGKTTIAEELSKRTGREIYTGKDYIKLAKNENEAKENFIQLLKDSNDIIYVISEKEQLQLLPENAIRIILTADLDTIKQRFSKRMKGTLPAPVEAMLEAKHGIFDNVDCQIHVENMDGDVSEICDKIISLI